MPQILVDDKTLSGLEAVATARGLTIAEYLQSLVKQEGNRNLPAFSVADFERELDEMATDGPTLSRDFSRADIYAEHDWCPTSWIPVSCFGCLTAATHHTSQFARS